MQKGSEGTECEQVSNQDAGKLIAGLVLHFMQKGSEGPECEQVSNQGNLLLD
jgi:hypothetical protein